MGRSQVKQRRALWKILVPVFVILFLLHCRMWHAEEEILMHTAFSSGSYLGLNRKIVAVLMAITMCSWMVYAYKKSTGKWYHWINLVYAFMCGSAVAALCTNILMVFLLWLNSCFTSDAQTREYIIADIAIHDRTRKSFTPRSGSWLLNTFSYGEVFIRGDRYTRIYLPINDAYQLSSERGVYLRIELEDGWLGWGVIRRIQSVIATKASDKAEVGSLTDEGGQPSESCLHEKSEKSFKYTRRDIHIFAKLRNINLSDTARVSINQYIDHQRGIPVWEIDIRDSIQPDKARVILIHGDTGEVVMDSYE